jgi:hypothetical protein
MKHSIITTFLVFVVCTSIKSQTCGVFRTADDFIQNRITTPLTSEKQQKSLKFDDFFLRPIIRYRDGKYKQTLPMDSVFALRTYTGRIYRIFEHQAFELVDTTTICLYIQYLKKKVYLQTSKGKRYHFKQFTQRYYSLTRTSPIIKK